MNRVAVKPVILVVSPMPLFPCSAGNRRRLLATCEFLKSIGFEVDLAYLAHEDHIYRRFGQHPPTDMDRMAGYFRRIWMIELEKPLRLKTGATDFYIDDWCPDELNSFVRWYFRTVPEAGAIMVNYVFLADCLQHVPEPVVRLLDTHDRFGDRRHQYHPFRMSPNFYFTSAEREATGLRRADIVLAIQPAEKTYFESLLGQDVSLLMPRIAPAAPFTVPKTLKAIGFMGHGNDANLISIASFVGEWQKNWQPSDPVLMIAGEICQSLPKDMGPGIQALGYVDSLAAFFDKVDLIIAPMLMGTGLKLKVVEALAYGKAVIGTPVAFEGLDSDSADHRLASIPQILSRLKDLTRAPQALSALVGECEDVYRRYLRDVDAGVEQLTARLSHLAKPCNEGRSVAPEAAATETETIRFGRTIVTRRTDVDSVAQAHADFGTLFATECRIATPGLEASAFAPSRTRWWIKLSDSGPSAVASSGPAVGIEDMLLNTAPLISKVRAETDDTTLTQHAANLISRARPDWSAATQDIVLPGSKMNLAFSGPSFLLRENVPKRVFLIDPDGDSSLEITRFSVKALTFRTLRPPELGPRCFDSSCLPIMLQCDLPASAQIPANGRRKLLVVSYGLNGHIHFENGSQKEDDIHNG